MGLTGFEEDTNVGRYVARKDAKIAEYEPDVPECENIAIENAANCNALPLDEATSTCALPPQCDSAGVRFYCELVGCPRSCCKGYLYQYLLPFVFEGALSAGYRSYFVLVSRAPL